jgi:hypothetical protein
MGWKIQWMLHKKFDKAFSPLNGQVLLNILLNILHIQNSFTYSNKRMGLVIIINLIANEVL